MPNFAENPEHANLLNISKEHLDAIDRTRVFGNVVTGQDNHAKLMVSTMFAAIAIEAALNDYVAAHYLFLHPPYLFNFFSATAHRLLKDTVHSKIDMLNKFRPTPIPQELLNDVRELIKIRNRIVHMTPELVTAEESDDGRAKMRNSSLTQEQMAHMLRHYQIARTFLGLFWYPGGRELVLNQAKADQHFADDGGAF